MKITYGNRMTRKRSGAGAPLIRSVVLAWIIAAAAEYLMLDASYRSLDTLTGIARMSGGRMSIVAGAAFVLLWALRKLLPDRTQRWMMAAAFFVLAAASLAASFTWAFFAACLAVFAVLIVYALRGWDASAAPAAVRSREGKQYRRATAGFAIVFFLLVSIWTVCRVYSFSTPTFDFGIFAQMFHSMKTTGIPMTTVERDGPLSHFAVHVSPVYYLLLPFYYLLPVPATLQLLQAAVLASAVIPLWKLGKHHNLPPLIRMLVCVLLLIYPAYAGGTSYDIHENAFLTPLMLWLFYGIDRKNTFVTAVSALLTLMVKEDAAVYVAVIALYLMLRAMLSKERRWGLTAGGCLLGASVVWFVMVTAFLAQSGDGVMTYRYKNFMYDGSDSLLTVVKAVLLNPMKAVFECVDAQKLQFIGLTMLPLGLLPLLTRRYERYVLLIPYVLVNLMSDYQYQHDIFFQYTYGATACLVYLTLVNLADWKPDFRQLAALSTALCISAGCFWVQIIPKAVRYPTYCIENAAYYDSLRSVLDVIPDEASVAATTYYTTHLSQRDVLYDVRYASTQHVLSCEYVVIGVTDANGLKKYAVNGEKGYDNLVQLLLEEGYQKIAEYEGRLEVYQQIIF